MDFSIRYTIFFSFFLFLSCSKSDPAGIDKDSVKEEDKWESHIPFKTNYGIFNMPITDIYEPAPAEQGRVELEEASGLAYSTVNPGMVWSHNDSGNPSVIYLIDTKDGQIVASYSVDGMTNRDWEDIEVSVGPADGVSYIYLSDTGDNDQKYSNYTVYRFVEPKFDESHRGKLTVLTDVGLDRIQFKYPGGSQDTEGMLVDPLTKDIYFVTKRSAVSMLFVAPYPQKVNEVYTIYKAGDFSFKEASAATCSLDGQRVLIKNRQDIFYWERQANETMVSMLARTPERAPYKGEEQGEAICFGENYSYYTLSEKANNIAYPILYKYTLK